MNKGKLLIRKTPLNLSAGELTKKNTTKPLFGALKILFQKIYLQVLVYVNGFDFIDLFEKKNPPNCNKKPNHSTKQ